VIFCIILYVPDGFTLSVKIRVYSICGRFSIWYSPNRSICYENRYKFWYLWRNKNLCRSYLQRFLFLNLVISLG